MVQDLDLPFANGIVENFPIFHHFASCFCFLAYSSNLVTLCSEMTWIRFVNTMGGHIWIESEGIDRGSIVAFIVQLGICDNHSDTTTHQVQMPPKGQANYGSGDVIGHKPAFRDCFGVTSSNARYQRSL